MEPHKHIVVHESERILVNKQTRGKQIASNKLINANDDKELETPTKTLTENASNKRKRAANDEPKNLRRKQRINIQQNSTSKNDGKDLKEHTKANAESNNHKGTDVKKSKKITARGKQNENTQENLTNTSSKCLKKKKKMESLAESSTRKRTDVDKSEKILANRKQTQIKQTKTTEKNTNNANGDKELAKEKTAPIETASNKRKRKTVDVPETTRQLRPRIKPSGKTEKNSSSTNDRQGLKSQAKSVAESSSRKRTDVDKSEKILANRKQTQSKQTKTTEKNTNNANGDKELAKEKTAPIETALNKRKRKIVDVPETTRELRPRMKPSEKTEKNSASTKDRQGLKAQTKAVAESISRKRIEERIDERRNVLSINLKRLTTEELQKHRINSTANDEAKGIQQVNVKTKRVGRKSMKMQLQERILNDTPVKEFLIGEIVLATIPGYSPWPARIQNITGQTIMIDFFGTGQVNLVRPQSISRLDPNKVIPFLNRKGYKKAIRELELVLGIPKELSLCTS